MQEHPETTERKEGRSLWTYAYWVGGILGLYVLSAGPAAKMGQTRVWSYHPASPYSFYSPFGWVYRNTPLRRPLGMYLHLWRPDVFATSGHIIPRFDEHGRPLPR